MQDSFNSTAAPGGRHQRRLRNLLLDRRFQLKYTGYLVAIAGVLGLSLGIILWRTSEQVISQAEENALRGAQIVELGKEVVAESRKVSAVVRMNIVKDPIYQDDPDLLAAFNSDAKDQDSRLDAQRERLEQQRASLVAEVETLESFHRRLLWSLCGALLLLVVCIGAAGIFVTHKVAGPIFKMKRHLRQVAKGQLQVPWGLRKGDELVHFFDAFRKMVAALRSERERHIELINGAIAESTATGSPDELRILRELKDEMEKSLV